MYRSFKKTSVVLLMAVLLVLAMCGTAYAAEATMSLGGGGTFEKGDTVTITLKYTGATFGAADAKITYDADVLEYSSCSGAEAGGGSGTLKITMAETDTDALTCKIKFKAKKVGKSTVAANLAEAFLASNSTYDGTSRALDSKAAITIGNCLDFSLTSTTSPAFNM